MKSYVPKESVLMFSRRITIEERKVEKSVKSRRYLILPDNRDFHCHTTCLHAGDDPAFGAE